MKSDLRKRHEKLITARVETMSVECGVERKSICLNLDLINRENALAFPRVLQD